MESHKHNLGLKNMSNLSICLIMVSVILSFSYSSVYSQVDKNTSSLSDQNTQETNLQEKFMVFVNLQRIDTYIELASKNLDSGKINNAFIHSYVPHKNIFPTIKEQLNSVDPSLSLKLESQITDLPMYLTNFNNNQKDIVDKIIVEIRNDIRAFIDKLITAENLDSSYFLLQGSLVLLRDVINISNDLPKLHSSEINMQYENIAGLLNKSKELFIRISDISNEDKNSILSLFSNAEKHLKNKDLPSLSSTLDSLEDKLINLSNNKINSNKANVYEKYFSNIRSLIQQALVNIHNSDYKQADKLVISAYLDNYEFLEAPLEEKNPKLMVDIELSLRENLRELIKGNESPQNIELFVTNVMDKIDKAELLLQNDKSISSNNRMLNSKNNEAKNLADIDLLKKGFGTFQGERKVIGDSDASTQQGVRSDIDQIRINLEKVLNLYKNEQYDDALAISRSAYLDSYEKIELPLRPIDPDFTLEMEIKFAELRNLIEQRESPEKISNTIYEIRKGLDESEILVSGVGSIAPGIAFTASFSLIFREGLESALIIGAITTYLEASRNDRFKRHVYFGIIIAAGATAITWFIAQFLIEISGVSKELIEAIAGISAVAVLFWVSFWVLNKIETKKWIEFVKSKVWKATATGSAMVFVLLAFFTVYREGFETVLFYQAMFSFAKHMELFIIAGLIAGLVVIISIAFIVNRLGKRLPLRVLFGVTMGIGAYMSITFLGNAIREFQEVGYIPTTHLFGVIPRLDVNLATMTGIHPTLESVVAQLILLSVYLVGSLYILVIQPRKKKMIESSRKSMSDFQKK
ncbi:MAG: FTR1 family protein [Nitrososphaeraceae archaeon]|nr:FTR1 family protein [Nitrososphaeraceae archaeon]